MSDLFPFINPPNDIVVENEMPLPLYSEVAWDFENNIPIIENGDFKIVEGDEAIKIWCFMSLKTERYQYSIYSWDYGCEISELFGKNYTPALIKAEAERFLKEALMINPYITGVDIISVDFSNSLLSASIKISTIYNEEGGAIEINV